MKMKMKTKWAVLGERYGLLLRDSAECDDRQHVNNHSTTTSNNACTIPGYRSLKKVVLKQPVKGIRSWVSQG
jgi:hypothetical protein